MKQLFVLDASGFLYRAYFAIQGLSSKRGEATNALFGFIRSYFKLVDEFHPDHLVAVFDGERSKESRTKLYKEYKAHRQKTPDDLISQIEEAKRFCHIMGIPILSVAGVEADDTIATISKWAEPKVTTLYVCSQDKDLYQLVDKKTFVINQQKDNLLIDAAKVKEQFGVTPEQMVDYLAIIGDSSDNVPGVSGFGPKTAVQLLHEHGTLENVLKAAHTVSGKKGETLAKEKDIALLSKRLVELNYNVDIPHTEHFYELKTPDWKELSVFFHEKDFMSLLKLIPTKETKSTTRYHTINTEKELDTLVVELLKQKEICIDTETTSENPMLATLVGIGFGYNLDDIYYVPLNGSIPRETILKKLKPLFDKTTIGFYNHNIKYDWHVLYNAGLAFKNISFDTIIASYLLAAHERRHSLDDRALEHFGKRKIAFTDLVGTGKEQKTIDQVPIERVSEYCCEDVEYTIRLKQLFEVELKKRGFEALFYDIEMPLILILAEMEQHGVFIDVEFLKKLSKEVVKDIKHVEEEIFTFAGERFNINSTKQLGEILFTKLLIPPIKRGKTAPSTSAEVLEILAVTYPIAQKILDYRSLEKLRSTYIDALPEYINPKTDRIHCQFNQSVTATGRLSCQDPNLQNIPVRTELGLKIREAFKPQKSSWWFVGADYSQIELRLLAHLTEDKALLEAFETGIDIHAFTASKIFNVPIDEVTSEMRRRAKAVNFGIVYGQQAYGLSQELHIPIKEAAEFIEHYYKRHPRVKEYIEHAKTLARKTGKAVTLTGRERLIPEINSPNQVLRAAAERLAINTPLQGTAADLIKIAMLKIDEWMHKQKLKGYLILQIHDELIFEVPDDEVETMKKHVKQHMENVFELKVPLTVQIYVGKNWKEC